LRSLRLLPMLSMPISFKDGEQETMPYDSTADLPASVRDNLREHAQEIYMEACTNAWKQSTSPESRRGGARKLPIGWPGER
jgi:hypothetical protein